LSEEKKNFVKSKYYSCISRVFFLLEEFEEEEEEANAKEKIPTSTSCDFDIIILYILYKK